VKPYKSSISENVEILSRLQFLVNGITTIIFVISASAIISLCPLHLCTVLKFFNRSG